MLQHELADGTPKPSLLYIERRRNSTGSSITMVVSTAVHGDLTFENILVGRGGQLWLIDAIDSPFDHYWLDWAKLFQECEGRWHAHRGRPISTSVTWWLRTRWMDAAAQSRPGISFASLSLARANVRPHSSIRAVGFRQ